MSSAHSSEVSNIQEALDRLFNSIDNTYTKSQVNDQMANKAILSISEATSWDSGNFIVQSGIWTPNLLANATLTFSERAGRYIRLGNLCWIVGNIAISTASALSSGSLAITGLPFKNTEIATSISLTYNASGASSANILSAVVLGNNSTIQLYSTTITGVRGSANSLILGNDSLINFSGVYKIA